jgi:hypothetical protein
MPIKVINFETKQAAAKGKVNKELLQTNKAKDIMTVSSRVKRTQGGLSLICFQNILIMYQKNNHQTSYNNELCKNLKTSWRWMMTKQEIYEKEKRIIEATAQTPEEYERRIKALLAKLKF